jgi:hypothetical protein
MARVCSKNGEKRTSYMILVEKPRGKRLLRRPGCGWMYNIVMNPRGIELDVLD